MEMSLTISKNSKDEVHIYVKDNSSRTRFLDLTLTLEDFANVLTGLSEVKVEGEVSGLEFVGKTKVRETRSVVVTRDIYDSGSREVLSNWITKNCQEDGWILDPYLGSKSSVGFNQDREHVTLNYAVYKYI